MGLRQTLDLKDFSLPGVGVQAGEEFCSDTEAVSLVCQLEGSVCCWSVKDGGKSWQVCFGSVVSLAQECGHCVRVQEERNSITSNPGGRVEDDGVGGTCRLGGEWR